MKIKLQVLKPLKRLPFLILRIPGREIDRSQRAHRMESQQIFVSPRAEGMTIDIKFNL